MKWRVYLKSLLEEIMQNPGTEILAQPLAILDNLLHQVAARAIELDDPKLNQLMVQLTLYSVADPQSPDFDPERVEAILYPKKGEPDAVPQR